MHSLTITILPKGDYNMPLTRHSHGPQVGGAIDTDYAPCLSQVGGREGAFTWAMPDLVFTIAVLR